MLKHVKAKTNAWDRKEKRKRIIKISKFLKEILSYTRTKYPIKRK